MMLHLCACTLLLLLTSLSAPVSASEAVFAPEVLPETAPTHGVMLGSEVIGFAAVSAMMCSLKNELSCFNVDAYNRYKSDTPGAENFSLPWAFETFTEGCTTASLPCYGVGTTPFGTSPRCGPCVKRGLGWCDFGYMVDIGQTITPKTHRFAPMCMDPNVFKACPYTADTPSTNCTEVYSRRSA